VNEKGGREKGKRRKRVNKKDNAMERVKREEEEKNEMQMEKK